MIFRKAWKMHGREKVLFHARKPLCTLGFQACSWKMEDIFRIFFQIEQMPEQEPYLIATFLALARFSAAFL